MKNIFNPILFNRKEWKEIGSVIRITLFLFSQYVSKIGWLVFPQSFDHKVHWNSAFERKKNKYICKKKQTYEFVECWCRDKWDEQNWFSSCYELFVRRTFAFWNFVPIYHHTDILEFDMKIKMYANAYRWEQTHGRFLKKMNGKFSIQRTNS